MLTSGSGGTTHPSVRSMGVRTLRPDQPLPLPVKYQVGELLVVVLISDGSTGTPSGWIRRLAGRMTVLTRRAVGSEGSTLKLSLSQPAIAYTLVAGRVCEWGGHTLSSCMEAESDAVAVTLSLSDFPLRGQKGLPAQLGTVHTLLRHRPVPSGTLHLPPALSATTLTFLL